MQKERKRRRNGEGCYYVRKDGRVIYKVRNGTNERGKPNYIEGYGKTEKEAYQNYLDKINGVIKPRRKKKDSYKAVMDSNKLVYFDEYIRFWMDHVKKSEVKPQFLACIREYVETYIIPYLGHYPVEEVTEELIRSLLDHARCGRKLGYWSVHKVYTHLKACLNFALAKGKIKKLYDSYKGCRGSGIACSNAAPAFQIKFDYPLPHDPTGLFAPEARVLLPYRVAYIVPMLYIFHNENLRLSLLP